MSGPDETTPRSRHRWRRLVALLTLVAMAAAACGGDDDDETGSTDDGGAAAEVDFASASGIEGGDPDFNLSVLVWQGYWLSRDHFGPFVMGSGLGVPFEPPMDAMQQAMEMVAQNPDDPVTIPQNLAPTASTTSPGWSAG